MSIVKFKSETELNKAGLMVDPATNEALPLLVGMTKAVNQRCARLKNMLGEAQTEVVGIGKDLIAIRAHLQENKVPGGFDGWLSREFDWSRSQAYRFIDIAKEFGEYPNLGHYDQSAMYLLAAPSTPQAAKDDAKQIAGTGEFVDYSTAATLIEKYKTECQDNTQTESGGTDEKTQADKSKKPKSKRRTSPTTRCRKASKGQGKVEEKAHEEGEAEANTDEATKEEAHEDEQTEIEPDETTEEAAVYTAHVTGKRSFHVHSESGYDVASVIHLLQIGEAKITEEAVCLGDNEIAWLEFTFNGDELRYSGIRLAFDEPPLEQITETPTEARTLPVLCLPDPGTNTVSSTDSDFEPQIQTDPLPFDPYFDEPLPLNPGKESS